MKLTNPFTILPISQNGFNEKEIDDQNETNNHVKITY